MRVLQKTTVRNCIIVSVWIFLFCCSVFFFWGRLDCRFSTMVFIVKRRSKTSDCLTRINLDLSTPPFYSLKRRKKAGVRTQSHSTDNNNTWTYTSRYWKRTGTLHTDGDIAYVEVRSMYMKCALNVHFIYVQCTFNVHLKCMQVVCSSWSWMMWLCGWRWREEVSGTREAGGSRRQELRRF